MASDLDWKSLVCVVMVQFELVGAADIWGAAEIALKQPKAAAASQGGGLSGINISADG